MPVDGKPEPESEQSAQEFSVVLRGSVEKIITTAKGSVVAQITIADADELYREIRVSNVFLDGNGGSVPIEQGTEVEIAIKVRRE